MVHRNEHVVERAQVYFFPFLLNVVLLKIHPGYSLILSVLYSNGETPNLLLKAVEKCE